MRLQNPQKELGSELRAFPCLLAGGAALGRALEDAEHAVLPWH